MRGDFASIGPQFAQRNKEVGVELAATQPKVQTQRPDEFEIGCQWLRLEPNAAARGAAWTIGRDVTQTARIHAGGGAKRLRSEERV